MKSREQTSGQKACNLLRFRQGWVGARCETHRVLGHSREHYSSFREGRVRGPASRMARQKRFQGISEGLKVLKKGVKYTTFVILVQNERSVGRNSSEIERAKK